VIVFVSVLSLVPFATLALGLTISPMPQDDGHRGRGDATRYASMDRNHDGVITRDEWHGSDQSFRPRPELHPKELPHPCRPEAAAHTNTREISPLQVGPMCEA